MQMHNIGKSILNISLRWGFLIHWWKALLRSCIMSYNPSIYLTGIKRRTTDSVQFVSPPMQEFYQNYHSGKSEPQKNTLYHHWFTDQLSGNWTRSSNAQPWSHVPMSNYFNLIPSEICNPGLLASIQKRRPFPLVSLKYLVYTYL